VLRDNALATYPRLAEAPALARETA